MSLIGKSLDDETAPRWIPKMNELQDKLAATEAEVEHLRGLAMTVLGRFNMVKDDTTVSSNYWRLVKAMDALEAGVTTPTIPPTDCQWPANSTFRVIKDDPADLHAPWFVAMPGGAMLSFNHHADDAVDQARAHWVASALNQVLAGAKPKVKEPLRSSEAEDYPAYQSHKVVWAFRIKDIIACSDGTSTLVPTDPACKVKVVEDAWVEKHKPEMDGYFVVYADGYQSFSPNKAFQDGYVPL